MTRTTILIAAALTTFFAITAGAKSPQAATLSDALTNVATARTPCSDLRASWKRTDAFGVVVSVDVRAGMVTVVRTRIGLGDETKTSVFQAAECHVIANTAVSTEAWAVEVPEVRGYQLESRPALSLGVEGAGRFVKYLPSTLTAEMAPLKTLSELLEQLGQRTLNPPRTARK